MFRLLRLFVQSFARLLYSRRHLMLENLVLRQQLAVLKSKNRRPKLATADKLFLVLTRRFWAGWRNALCVVSPETVIRWHRAGFRLYWKWLSRHKARLGRKRIGKQVRDLVFQMVADNPTWRAPRIHGELKMLGFEVSERTISRWIRRAPRNPEPAKRWLAFMRNHREVIAAMDFFTVPTLTFGVLYCFLILAHDRRRILHFNVTANPTGAWVMQQLREAFPYEFAPKYLIFDRDAKFDPDVVAAVRTMGSQPIRTSFQSPWQNGVAERWIGSCRRDLLDHVIVLNERHLRRLLAEYVHYYHEDRTHLGLGKETPHWRAAQRRSGSERVVSQSRLGGLHHRYDLTA